MAATRSASTDKLSALVAGRVAEMRTQGTTTVEIKSGYGLTVADEFRSLEVARQFDGDDIPCAHRATRMAERPGRLPRPGHRADARYRSALGALDRRLLLNRDRRTRSTPTRLVRWSSPDVRPDWICGYTATSSAPDRASSSRSSWARPASTTARISPPPISTPSLTPQGAPSSPSCPVSSSAPTPLPDATRLLRAGVWIALATDCNREPATPPRCRS